MLSWHLILRGKKPMYLKQFILKLDFFNVLKCIFLNIRITKFILILIYKDYSLDNLLF